MQGLPRTCRTTDPVNTMPDIAGIAELVHGHEITKGSLTCSTADIQRQVPKCRIRNPLVAGKGACAFLRRAPQTRSSDIKCRFILRSSTDGKSDRSLGESWVEEAIF